MMRNLEIIGGCLIGDKRFSILNNQATESFESFSALRRSLEEQGRLTGKWNVFSRFSTDAKQFCMACAIALDDAGGLDETARHSCAVICADRFEHERDQREYFRDYVDGGRELGRSSLFVHTLPTSAAADASVCMGLAGPLLYWHDEDDILGGLELTAASLAAEGSAQCALIVFHEKGTCLSLLLGPGERTISFHGAYEKLHELLDGGPGEE